MSHKLVKTIIGALVAVALALAVSYGMISQDTADKVTNQANEILKDDKAAPPQTQQPAPQQPAPQAPAPEAQAPASPQAPAPAPRQ